MTITMKRNRDLMKSVAVLTVLVMVCSVFVVSLSDTSVAGNSSDNPSISDYAGIGEYPTVPNSEPPAQIPINLGELSEGALNLFDMMLGTNGVDTDGINKSGKILAIEGNASYDSLMVEDAAEISFKNEGKLAITDGGVLYIEKSASFKNAGSPVNIVLGSGATLIIGNIEIQADNKMEITSDSDFKVSGFYESVAETGFGYGVSVDLAGDKSESSLTIKNSDRYSEYGTTYDENTTIVLKNGNPSGADFNLDIDADLSEFIEKYGSVDLTSVDGLFAFLLKLTKDGETPPAVAAKISVSSADCTHSLITDNENARKTTETTEIGISGFDCTVDTTRENSVLYASVGLSEVSLNNSFRTDKVVLYDDFRTTSTELTVSGLDIEVNYGAESSLSVKIGNENLINKRGFADFDSKDQVPYSIETTEQRSSDVRISASGESAFILSVLDVIIGINNEEKSDYEIIGDVLSLEVSPFELSFAFDFIMDYSEYVTRNNEYSPYYYSPHARCELIGVSGSIVNDGENTTAADLSVNRFVLVDDLVHQHIVGYGSKEYLQESSVYYREFTGLDAEVEGNTADVVGVLKHYLVFIEKNDFDNPDISGWFNSPDIGNIPVIKIGIDGFEVRDSMDFDYKTFEKVELPADFDECDRSEWNCYEIEMENLQYDMSPGTEKGTEASLNLGTVRSTDKHTYILIGKTEDKYSETKLTNLHIKVNSDYADITDVVAAVTLCYLVGPDDIDDNIREDILEYAITDSKTSVEVSFDLLIGGDYETEGSESRTLREIYVGSDESPATGYNVTSGYEITTNFTGDMKLAVGLGASFVLSENSTISVTDNELGLDGYIDDIDVKVTLKTEIDVAALSRNAEPVDFLIGSLFDSSAEFDLHIGEMGGSYINGDTVRSVFLTGVKYNGSGKIGNLFDNDGKLLPADILAGMGLSGVTIGGITVSESKSGDDGYEVTVTLYNGTVKLGEPGDKTLLTVVCESRNVEARGMDIPNLIENGRYIGPYFVIGSDGIGWSIVEKDGTLTAPELKEGDSVCVSVPMIVLDGVLKGEYPAGIQTTVKSDDISCIGWKVVSEGTEKIYRIGEVVTFRADATVTEAHGYSVTFESGGKVIGTVYGNTGDKFEYPEAPVRDGYDFGGWNSKVTVIGTSDIVIVALWNETLVADDARIDGSGNAQVGERESSGFNVTKENLIAISDKIESDRTISVLFEGVDIELPVSAVGLITGEGSENVIAMEAYPVTDVRELAGFGVLSADDAEKLSRGVAIRVNLTGVATTSNLGVVKVSNIGYTPAEGEDLGKIRVCCLNGDGTIEYLNSGFDSETKTVWFETTHFSEFVVFNDPGYGNGTGNDAGNDYTVAIIAIVSAAIVVIGLSVAFRPRKN